MNRRALIAGLAFLFVGAGIFRSVESPRDVSADPAPAPVIPPGFEERLQALEAENARMAAELESLEESVLAGTSIAGPLLHRYPVPAEVTLCGERVPLERPDVYQRFEEEWTRYLVNQHWLIKWMRRSRDIFPYVETQLETAGMPDDLKYVLIVESGLESRAYSSAGAAGWWQFIKSTGNRYGLDRNSVVDERRDLGLATEAAIKYFARLHEEFQSWPLSLSAYNAGEKRVRDEINSQGEDDFYRLSLPRETEAYWFKAAALKVLMEHPRRYGLELTEDPWVAAVCDTLQLKVKSHRVDLKDIAAGAGISYREFRELNPAYRKSWVPRGTHRFVLPHEGADRLLESLDGVELAGRQSGERVVETAAAEDAPAAVAAEDAAEDAAASGLNPQN